MYLTMYLKRTKIVIIPLAVLVSLWVNVQGNNESSGRLSKNQRSSESITLMIARPVDATSAKNSKNLWFAAIAELYFHFRMGILSELQIVPRQVMAEKIPLYDDISAILEKEKYLEVCSQEMIDYLLYHKYEIFKGGNAIKYYSELINAKNGKLEKTIEREFDVENVGTGLDAYINELFAAVNYSPAEEFKRFFSIPILSNNAKSLKILGNSLIADLYGTEGVATTRDIYNEYTKILVSEPSMLLATYAAYHVCEKAGKFYDAIRCLRELITIIPNYRYFYLRLATNYRLCRDYKNALASVNQLQQMGVKRTVPILLESAYIYDSLGASKRVYEIAKEVLELNDRQPDALLFAAQQAYKGGRIDEALNYAQRLTTVAPNNSHGYLEKGKSLIIKGNYSEAEIALTKAMELSPNNIPTLIALADIQFQQKNYEKAASIYDRILPLRKRDLELHLKAAIANELAQKNDKALDILRRAEAFHPTHIDLRKRLGILEYKLKDYHNALVHLEGCLETSQQDWQVLTALADIYTSKKEFSKAMSMYKLAIPYVLDQKQCNVGLAKVYVAMNNPLEAIKECNKVLSVAPLFPDANRYLADAYFLLGERTKALAHYRKELTAAGADSLYLRERIGTILFEQSDYGLAKEEFERLCAKEPSNVGALVYLGCIYLRSGKKHEAEKLITKALNIGKNLEPKLWLQLGKSYSVAGLHLKASEAFQKCLSTLSAFEEEALKNLAESMIRLERDSIAAETYLRLFAKNQQQNKDYCAQAGYLFLKAKAEEKARECFQRFLNAGFWDDQVSVNYAMLEMKAGNYQSVIDLLGNLKGVWNKDEQVVMMLAEACYKRGDFYRTIETLEPLFRNGSSTKALELCALAYEKTNNIEKAVQKYEAYLESQKADKKKEISFHLGQLYESTGQLQKAIKRYRVNIEYFPDDFRNFERLAELTIKTGNYSEAELILKSALNIANAPNIFNKKIASVYEMLNNYNEAIRYYKKFLKAEGQDIAALYGVGKNCFFAKRYAESIDALEKVVEANPSDYQALIMLGTAYFEQGKFEQAAAFLTKALIFKKDDVEILKMLARCYRSNKNDDALIDVLQKWVALEQDNYSLYMELGNLLLDKKSEKAISILQKASQMQPANIGLHLLLVKIFWENGNIEAVRNHLNTAMKFAPDNAELNFEQAKLSLHERNVEAAETYLKSAIRINPDYLDARYYYARLLLSRKDAKAAFEQLRRIWNSSGITADHALLYSQCAMEAGSYEHASSAIMQAISLDSTRVDILQMAGLIFKEIKQMEIAKAYFTRALNLDPNCISCREQLGDIYLEEMKFEKAIGYLSPLVAANPQNTKVAIKLGKAYTLCGDNKNAEKVFAAILAKEPNNNEALYRACVSALVRSDMNEAQKKLELLGSGEKSVWYHLASAQLSEARGDMQVAFISYNVAAKLMPQNPEALSGCGRVCLAQRRYDEAIEFFQKAIAQDPYNINLIINMGEAYEGKGQIEAALNIYTEIARVAPKNCGLNSLIARAYSKSGNHEKAIAALQTAAKCNGKDYKIFYELGKEYSAVLKFEEAIRAFKKAAEKGKDKCPDAYKLMGDIYFNQLQDPQNAKKAFQNYLKAGGKEERVAEQLKKLAEI